MERAGDGDRRGITVPGLSMWVFAVGEGVNARRASGWVGSNRAQFKES